MPQDLLKEGNSYRLANTGQGINRVQSAPLIANAMHTILGKVQQAAGSWVGLSVVHLGDRDVPNALVFIDKYTQIARLLKPVVDCIKMLPGLAKQPTTAHIISKYGGAERLQKLILADFFKHGFDGSGSDGGKLCRACFPKKCMGTSVEGLGCVDPLKGKGSGPKVFRYGSDGGSDMHTTMCDDAGSCIDGRLTSAWNWCSKIEKKVWSCVGARVRKPDASFVCGVGKDAQAGRHQRCGCRSLLRSQAAVHASSQRAACHASACGLPAACCLLVSRLALPGFRRLKRLIDSSLHRGGVKRAASQPVARPPPHKPPPPACLCCRQTYYPIFLLAGFQGFDGDFR